MPQDDTLFSATLQGEIIRIVYRNQDDTYTVLRLRDKQNSEKTVVGALNGLEPGQCIEVTGRWEKHSEYGAQFRAVRFRPLLPTTREGIIRFLGSGAIPGIGEKTAKLIVDYFGAETLNVLDKCPRRLCDVPGIGKKKAAAVTAKWRESETRRDIFIYLQGLGITPGYCQKLYRRYGDKTADVVRANPYRLAEDISGIGFLKADEIAAGVGIARDAPERLTAAAVYEINLAIGNGHTGCPEAQFVRNVAELAGQPPERAEAGIERAITRHLLVRQDGMIMSPALARAERELPKRVRLLAQSGDFAGRRCRTAAPGKLRLNAAQQLAVDRVSECALTIITGGPGVGKTTVVGEIVRRAERAGIRIVAAAPTGRAAKRLGEATGITAKTLHRLLAFDPQTGRFGYDDTNVLPCDLLIVDEVSMLDLLLALALFRAVAPGTSVVLVGDRDQLPSVGPGTVLASFIESGWFLTTELTEVFRQAQGSRIISNAHRVNRGMLPENGGDANMLSDFYWIEQDDPDRVLELIIRLTTERIPRRFRLDPFDDIQVLTPMNRGICGTVAVNARLQQVLNGDDKPQLHYGERCIRSGDKVMQTCNNYEKMVFNGDLGRVSLIDRSRKTFRILFDGNRAVEYAWDEAEQITPAYAITVHKSQGSEFPAVILPMLTQHFVMLQRNLLYTAMTRARRLLVIIGSRRALEIAVRNTRMAPRYSRLTERMISERRSQSPDGAAPEH